MPYSITLRHTFEAAHRLPHIGGKCRNIHGHSWTAEVSLAAPTLTDERMIVEFGAFKHAMREWIDDQLDHALLLGAKDPLVEALVPFKMKMTIFVSDGDGNPDWPTVESVARMIGRRAFDWIPDSAPPGVRISRVRLRETASNVAEWIPLS